MFSSLPELEVVLWRGMLVCVCECVQCARTQRVVCGVVSLCVCVCECDLLVAWSSLVSNFSFQFGAQFVLHCS